MISVGPGSEARGKRVRLDSSLTVCLVSSVYACVPRSVALFHLWTPLPPISYPALAGIVGKLFEFVSNASSASTRHAVTLKVTTGLPCSVQQQTLFHTFMQYLFLMLESGVETLQSGRVFSVFLCYSVVSAARNAVSKHHL